ncbi:MAG: tetraacyldisaccharide 4'-kinase [Burkholderiaceae bacterium]|jgi:tetraacyldisaccharide 4'-kinase|nr:tetraacyldisaccharide 4'-kinase [Burkholderiaceae bacterium]
MSARLQAALISAWTRRGPLACALLPLAALYGALAGLRGALYRLGWRSATRLPVPVVVVGNVIVGGAGKTPVTLAVAEHLKARGWQPGIVSRGYGRAGDGCREVMPGADPRAVGDEPLLLRRRAGVPVFVARRRAQAARALLAAHPECDILLCDDGLQHLALARDVDVVVFDARGAGNGWLLPAGPLREPWPRKTFDLVLQTEAGDAPLALPPGAQLFEARRALAGEALRADGARVLLAALRGQPLAALAGIARPEAFFAMLRAAGLTLVQTHALPDHYDFNSYTPRNILAKTLICTEKDAIKLWPLAPDALAVPLALEVPPAFYAALDERLAARGYHPRRTSPEHHGPQTA